MIRHKEKQRDAFECGGKTMGSGEGRREEVSRGGGRSIAKPCPRNEGGKET